MNESTASEVQSSDRTLALLTHLSGIFLWFIPPLIVYLIKKDESRWIRQHAAAALNFQLTLLIAWVVSFLLVFVLIGIVLLWALGITNLILCIVAAIKANDGKPYEYPLAIRFVS